MPHNTRNSPISRNTRQNTWIFAFRKKIPFIAVAFIAVTFIARLKSPFKMNGNDLFSPPNSLYSKREITFLALKDFLVWELKLTFYQNNVHEKNQSPHRLCAIFFWTQWRKGQLFTTITLWEKLKLLKKKFKNFEKKFWSLGFFSLQLAPGEPRLCTTFWYLSPWCGWSWRLRFWIRPDFRARKLMEKKKVQSDKIFTKKKSCMQK